MSPSLSDLPNLPNRSDIPKLPNRLDLPDFFSPHLPNFCHSGNSSYARLHPGTKAQMLRSASCLLQVPGVVKMQPNNRPGNWTGCSHVLWLGQLQAAQLSKGGQLLLLCTILH